MRANQKSSASIHRSVVVRSSGWEATNGPTTLGASSSSQLDSNPARSRASSVDVSAEVGMQAVPYDARREAASAADHPRGGASGCRLHHLDGVRQLLLHVGVVGDHQHLTE